jgi:hypothetical protein
MIRKNNKGEKMKKEKIVCTHCKSDKIEYVPTPFQGQESWFDVRYEQQKNGKFKAVIKGDTPEKERTNVNTIDIRTMSYNDDRPWMHCLACTAELDGFRDVESESV